MVWERSRTATAIPLAVALLVGAWGSHAGALPLPVEPGTNMLSGRAAGDEESYVGAPGDYTMPNGSTSGPAGTPGMMASISVGPTTTAPFGQVSLPQPATVPGSDSRSGTVNPLLGGARWRPRVGAVIAWDQISDGGAPVALLPSGSVTGVVHGLTPLTLASSSGFMFDDGTAPGSVAFDSVPDALPFALDPDGRRTASFTSLFAGPEDGGLFGGFTPAPLLGSVELWEGGDVFDPDAPSLSEFDFDHNGGPFAGEALDARDGTLLLGGTLVNAMANYVFTETSRGSGMFEMDVDLTGDVTYGTGSLLGSGVVHPGSAGSLHLKWEDIDVTAMIGSGGLDYNGPAFDYPAENSTLAEQTFEAIPEPATVITCPTAMAAVLLTLWRRRRAC